MGKPIQLSIADPCHENWDSMTATERGRFCNSCQKQVVDFTSMSDAELTAFFKRSSAGAVCGRFYHDQLDRDMQVTKKAIPWMKYFFQIALPTFLMSAKAVAQGNTITKKENITVSPQPRLLMGKVAAPVKKIEAATRTDIKGRVVDENNQPVAYASVMVRGGKLGMMADSSGVFTMRELLLNENIVLEVSSAGYQSKEVIINKQTDSKKELVVQLTHVVDLDEVIVVTYSIICTRTVIMGSVSRVPGIEMADTIPGTIHIKPSVEKPAMIKVYPNPVLSGTAINIGCEKLEEGYYSYRLFNQAGQMIQHKQIWIDAEATIMNMEIPSVASGSYILTLTHKESRKRFSEKIIIQ